MKPEDVLAHPARGADRGAARRLFQRRLPGAARLRAPPMLHVCRMPPRDARPQPKRRQPDGVFVLEEGHSAVTPRLHRVTSPQDQHPDFWAFICDPIMTDLAADVVGPDVKFHHAKLNVKSERGTRGFKWHQDIPAWPHTDYSPVTIGIYINGCDGAEQGPLTFVKRQPSRSVAQPVRRGRRLRGPCPRRHRQVHPARKHRRRDRRTRHHRSAELPHDPRLAGEPLRPARPLLLPVYSSADSFAYTPSPIVSPHMGDIVRGRPARYASFDTRPCELPPDFRGGYKPPWLAQKEEDERTAAPALAM